MKDLDITSQMSINFAAYNKLTRIATKTDRSQMSPEVHRAFMTYIDRAQQILRLEALQAGFDFDGGAK